MADYHPTGLVVDYITVSSGTSITFASGTTYYVAGNVSFSGTVTFQGGCVVKYAPNTYMLITGGVSCQGSSQNPSILTSRDDYQFGETSLPSANGCPSQTASKAIWYYSQGGTPNFTGLRIRYANTGIFVQIEGGYGSVGNTVFESSQTGTYADATLVNINTGYVTREVAYPYAYRINQPYGTWNVSSQTTLREHIINGTQALTAGHDPNNW